VPFLDFDVEEYELLDSYNAIRITGASIGTMVQSSLSVMGSRGSCEDSASTKSSSNWEARLLISIFSNRVSDVFRLLSKDAR